MSRGETRGMDSVGLYLSEIGMVPLLDAAEEVELAQSIERGSWAAARLEAEDELSREQQIALERQVAAKDVAKDRFVRANLRLVVSVARRYPVPAGMELLDLIQEGNLGLEHAVDKFDWRKGFKFSTYATFWIRQAIGRAIDQKANIIRLPGDRSAALRAALRAVSGNPEELDAENARLHRLATTTSLNVTSDDGESEFGDIVPSDTLGPEAEIMKQLGGFVVADVLSALPSRERIALLHRFGFIDGKKRSYREIGEHLGITPEGARRIVLKGVKALRNSSSIGVLAGTDNE